MASTSGIPLHIPASVAEAIRLPEAQREQALQRELALALYTQGLVSFGKARELTAMDKAAFGRLLGERGIPRHYGPEELRDHLNYARRQ